MENTLIQYIQVGFAKLRFWYERKITIKKLMALDEHLLNDIGMERRLIERSVDELCRRQHSHWCEQNRRKQLDSDRKRPTHNLHPTVKV